MKKSKMIPAFLNALTYNERKYLSHFIFAGILFGMFMIYGVFVSAPEIINNKFNISDQSFIIHCFLLALFLIETLQYSKYKKLIKLEPKVKQKKEDY